MDEKRAALNDENAYEVAHRTPDISEDVPAGRRFAVPMAPLARGTAIVAALAVAVGAWTLLPDPTPVIAPAGQQLLGQVETAEKRRPEPAEEATHEKEDKKPEPGVPRRKKGRKHVTFSLVASSSSPAPAPAPAPASSGQPQAKKAPKKPAPPQATLAFVRAYKERSGNHYHSTDAGEIETRTGRGFEVAETIGYLFDRQIEGTRMLAIDEGVMGYIYESDPGRRAVPLYRLTGPAHHNYETIFTSSEKVKTEWEGNGWRLTRIEGYIVSAP